MPMVAPSGAALAMASAPILPLAPARLSTTTCWPSRPESLCAMMRATMSVLLPAGNGTIRRIGRSGQAAVCALPALATKSVRMIVSSRSIALSTNLQDKLAAQVPPFADFVGGCRVGQRIELDLRRAYGALGEQLDDAIEMATGAFGGGPQRSHVGTAGRRCLYPRRDEGTAAARAQHRERFLRDVAADRVEHGVAIGDHLGEVPGVVVDDLVGADATQVLMIGRAGDGNHAGADMLGELDREAGNAAGAALNENPLAGLELECLLDGADRGEAGQRHGGGDLVRHGVGLLGHQCGLDRELLGIGAIAAEREHAEDGIAHAQIGHAVTDRADHAGEIAL